MKKKLSALALLCVFSLGLSSCNSNSSNSEIIVENGAFTSTPQEIIDDINTHVEQAGTDEYYLCDPFVSSGESIFTNDEWSRVILQFETNQDGNITYCQLYWSSAFPIDNAVATAGLYSTVILNTLSPNNSDEILDSITEIVASGHGNAEYDENGVSVEFTNSDLKNWLEIFVSE